MTLSLLTRLFPRHSTTIVERWREGLWTHEEGDLARLPEFQGLEEVSLETLLQEYPLLRADAYGAEPGSDATSGPSQRPLRSWERLGAAEALAHYRDGHTLVFWDLEGSVPAAAEGGRRIAQELGCLPPEETILGACPRIRGFGRDASRVALSFTPTGADVGLGAHFDKFDSIALQVRGRKLWHLAAPDRLAFPLDNEVATQAGLPPYMTMGSLRRPAEADFGSVVLSPGAALLNPRGTWHATGGEAQEESLTLLFRFQFPVWADVLATALRAALLRDPALRQTAFGLFAEGGVELSAADLERPWSAAKEALERGEGLLYGDFLGRLADRRRARFSLLDGARIELRDRGVHLRYADGRGELVLPAEVAKACAWIIARGSALFALEELEEQAPELGDVAWVLLRYLADAGILAVRWASTESSRLW